MGASKEYFVQECLEEPTVEDYYHQQLEESYHDTLSFEEEAYWNSEEAGIDARIEQQQELEHHFY